MANKNKIFGGSETLPHEYPWNVYLSMNVNGKSYMCGGSIISKEHVLTAAHCVDDKRKEDIYVRLGKVNLSLKLDNKMIDAGAHNKNEPEITARVSNIDIHSTWNGDFYNGPDAAVSIREVIKNKFWI